MASVVIEEQEGVSRPCVIQVRGGGENLAWSGYAPILESVLPVKVAFGDGSVARGAGELVFEDVPGPVRSSSRPAISTLRLPQGRREMSDGRLTDITVHFADDGDVPFPFRGRSLRTKVGKEPIPIALGDAERPLATYEGRLVWAISVRGGVRHFRSGFALPNMASGSDLSAPLVALGAGGLREHKVRGTTTAGVLHS
jgi:hypothetical protein